jgi:hypothetical protein
MIQCSLIFFSCSLEGWRPLWGLDFLKTSPGRKIYSVSSLKTVNFLSCKFLVKKNAGRFERGTGMKEFRDGDDVYVVFKWNIHNQLGKKVGGGEALLRPPHPLYLTGFWTDI